MHHLFEWEIAGFYVDYQRVWYPEPLTTEALRDAVWLDLDISREYIKSIGHHILLSAPADALACHKESVNPNLLRGVTGRAGGGRAAEHGAACPCGGQTFPHKYPLGTIHFLLWLHGVKLDSIDGTQVALLWLADSSWINGQSHRYRKNVLDWVQNWVSHPALSATVGWIDTTWFEQLMKERVFPRIEAAGFGRGTGQVTSRHLGLGGYQCQFGNPNERHGHLQALADLVAEYFGWTQVEIPQPPYVCVEGRRNPERYTLAEVRRRFGSVSAFIRGRDTFSYVIPNAGQINYTVGVPL